MMLLSRIARGAATALGILCAGTLGDAAAETAEYQVTFQSTWSQATHPIDFPLNAHFSGLIGATHTDQVSFWNVNSLASLGIKNMAELGAKTELMLEVEAAISAGTADAVLSGGGIGSSPGSVSLTFSVDDAYPLVTLVSMLAPSPDWFVGVSGLSLHENGAWIPQAIVELVAYDAGTDSGPSYASPNQATLPPVPIVENTLGPFATNRVVGTYTFDLVAVVDVPRELHANQGYLVSLGPNPLRQATRFQFRIPSGRSGDLAVYGIGGQRICGLFRCETADQPRVVIWNGRDDRDTLVPPGVYFVTLDIDGIQRRAAKVAVVR